MSNIAIPGGNTPKEDDDNYGKKWYMVTLLVIGTIITIAFLVGLFIALRRIQQN